MNLILFAVAFTIAGWVHSPKKRRELKKRVIGDDDENTSLEGPAKLLRKPFSSACPVGPDNVPETWNVLWRATRKAIARERWRSDETLPVLDLTPPAGGIIESLDVAGLGKFIFRCLIATTGSSVLISAFRADMPSSDFVIKFTNDCFKRMNNPFDSILHSEHSIVEEYVLLSAAGASEAVPRVLLYSAPVTVTRPISPHAGSKHFMNNVDECLKIGTQLRYMVEEKVGPVLAEVISDLHSQRDMDVDLLRTMIGLGKKLVNLTRDLHSHGIIHNDIHIDNVAFRHSDLNLDHLLVSKLVFIDFGESRFYPDEMGTSIDGPKSSDHMSPLHMSPWHLQGYRT